MSWDKKKGIVEKKEQKSKKAKKQKSKKAKKEQKNKMNECICDCLSCTKRHRNQPMANEFISPPNETKYKLKKKTLQKKGTTKDTQISRCSIDN